MARQLTAKQNKFIDGVVSGLSQSEAYRQAYNAERMAVDTVANKAYALATRGDIRAIIKQKQKELANKAIWSREQALTMLRDIAVDAMDDRGMTKPQMRGVAVRAIEQANKMCGYNEPDKVDHTGAIKIELSGDLADWAK